MQKKIKDLRAPSKVNYFEQMLYTDLVIDEMKNIFTSKDYKGALKRSDSFDFKRHKRLDWKLERRNSVASSDYSGEASYDSGIDGSQDSENDSK